MTPPTAVQRLWEGLCRGALAAGAQITAPRIPIKVMRAKPSDVFQIKKSPSHSWEPTGYSLEEETEEVPDFKVIVQAVDQRVVSSPEFGEFVEAMRMASGAEPEAIERSVKFALQWAAYRGEGGSFPAVSVALEDLTNYLKGGEFGHRTTFWLRGVRVASVFEAFPGFRIRPMELKDLEYRVDHPWGALTRPGLTWADAVGVYEFVSLPQGYAQMREYVALRFLRLITGASVSWSVAEHRPRTPVTLSGVWGRTGSDRDSVVAKVTLSDGDAGRIKQLWARLSPLIRDPRFPEETPLWVALDRFEKSLLLPGTVDQRNLWAVMGLEALILEDGADLTRAFRQRCAFLAEAWGMNGLETDAMARRAYLARSRFVHGDRGWPNDEAIQIAKDASACSEILRRLILFLLLRPTDKKPLITALDRALISEKERDQLLEKLREPAEDLVPVGVLE